MESTPVSLMSLMSDPGSIRPATWNAAAWRSQAACSNMDTELFFPVGESAQVSEQIRMADRHFPQRSELLSKASWPRSPRDWVEFYLLMDMDAETMRQELLRLGITNIDAACARLARSRQQRPEAL